MILETYGKIRQVGSLELAPDMKRITLLLDTRYGEYQCIVLCKTNALLLAGRPVVAWGLHYKNILFCQEIKNLTLKTFGVLQEIPAKLNYKTIL